MSIVHRVLSIRDARTFIGAALLDQWPDRPNDPLMLLIFKIPEMHPPSYMGEARERFFSMLPDPDAPEEERAQFTMPKHFLESTMVLGSHVFVADGGKQLKRDQTFAMFYVPRLPGFSIRK